MRTLWISVAMVALAGAEPGPVHFTRVAQMARLQAPAVTEASGIAIASANPQFMWMINDSGGTADIHLTGTDGSNRGNVTLKGVANTDWEDLAAFSLQGKHYLLVADTGDNAAQRPSCVLHILREPELPFEGNHLAATVMPAWQIEFQYEGGPRDCEAVAVDAKAGKIILISKRTNPPEVYELPLRPNKNGLQTARRVGQITVKAPEMSIVPFRNQPTGLAITADGSLAAVVTYSGVFLFPCQANESWAAALAKPPAALEPHLLPQAEAVAFSKDGKRIHVASEGKDAPIRIYQR